MHELSKAQIGMKISAAILGRTTSAGRHEIDARWLMAYAAALGETATEYFDTTRPDGITAHPLFPVCYEWPLALELRATTLGDAIAIRGVHATHDLTLYRLPSPGDHLVTTARVVVVEPRAPGAYVLSRFETVDGQGRPVSTTDYGSLYRGVDCEGALGQRDEAPTRPNQESNKAWMADWSTTVAISPTLAHVYSECARIWNPIHTDRAIAHAAGLPDIILHGTATLALAVSAVLNHASAASARSVRRVSCRFSGMVRLPSTITVRGGKPSEHGDGNAIPFQVLDAEGRPAVTQGAVILAR
jgi:MaoC like domain/N-terminal half of MaoC dehydratase